MFKKLGKISNINFGHVGYQDAMLGLSFTLDFDGFRRCENICFWDAEMIECSERSKWTEQDRTESYDMIMRKISKLLSEAKVSNITSLKGIPIEATFDSEFNGILKDWRILTEVL